MALQMSFGGGDITGKLRDGAEERIRASSLSGIHGKRIVIESVTVHYRLENQPAREESSEYLAPKVGDWAV